MSSRKRQSGVSSTAQRQGAPSSSATAAPDYEPMLYPLTPSAQNALNALKRTHQLGGVQKHFKEANRLLAECGYEIHEAYTSRKDTVERQRSNAEKKGEGIDQEAERKLAALKEKVDQMTSRMEENTRLAIDGEQTIQDMDHALTFAAQTSHGARSGHQRSTQQNSFDPTLPGATEDDSQETLTVGPGPSALFKQQIDHRKLQYSSLTMETRYAEHNEYIGFKRSIHDGMYPGGEVPMPASNRWFREGGSPAPGTAAAQQGEDSDEDVAISGEKISTKCPLTLMEFVDPITSTKCPHTFEKNAILEMIRGAPGRKVTCPVPGCRVVRSIQLIPFLYSSSMLTPRAGTDCHDSRKRPSPHP
jgi:hypothetical protein